MIASIDRAADHAAIVAGLVVVAAVVGLVYWLIQLVEKRRAGRTRPGGGSESAGGPEA